MLLHRSSVIGMDGQVEHRSDSEGSSQLAIHEAGADEHETAVN